MKKVNVCDLTLRESALLQEKPGFRERIEIARLLDRIGVDVIETEPFSGSRADVLYLHTIAPIVKNAAVSCPVKLSEESVEGAWNAVKNAARPILNIMIPVSTVQMEYICRKKPAAVLEMIGSLVKKAKSLCPNVEFTALDATRSDRDFLVKAIEAALAAGATMICVCDSVGTMLPSEVKGFLDDVQRSQGIGEAVLSAECSNAAGLGVACAISALDAGVDQIKTAVTIDHLPALDAAAAVFRSRGEALGYETNLNHTVLEHSCKAIGALLHPSRPSAALAILVIYGC